MLQLRLALFRKADNQAKWAIFGRSAKHHPVTEHTTLKTDQNSGTKSYEKVFSYVVSLLGCKID